MLTLLLVLSTATAGAVIGRRVVGRRLNPSVSVDHPAEVAPRPRHQVSRKQRAELDDFSLPAENTPSAEAAVPVEPRRPGAVHLPRAMERSTPERSVTAPVSDEKAQPGHQLVVEAMLALRRARDAQRAGILLEDYLTKYPQGALREEAIALAVEAAAARADLARRDYWASEYLNHYPTGRFRKFVDASRAAGK